MITGLDELVARRTKGIRRECGNDLTIGPTLHDGVVGTDFRHAVEFSRSGRAPSTAFRLVSGATRVTLRGWLRGVKPGGLPHHPRPQPHTRRRTAHSRRSWEGLGLTRRTGS